MVKSFALLHLFYDIMIVAPRKQRWSFLEGEGETTFFSLERLFSGIGIHYYESCHFCLFCFFPLLRISDSRVLEAYKSLQLQYA